MSRGGNRPGAGRKSGTPNKASVERQKKVAATGDAPLEYTLKVMRDSKADALGAMTWPRPRRHMCPQARCSSAHRPWW